MRLGPACLCCADGNLDIDLGSTLAFFFEQVALADILLVRVLPPLAFAVVGYPLMGFNSGPDNPACLLWFAGILVRSCAFLYRCAAPHQALHVRGWPSVSLVFFSACVGYDNFTEAGLSGACLIC